jgi:hypothetical protein
MTDQQVLELLLEEPIDEPSDYGVLKIKSFAKAGIVSKQAGVIVTMDDNAEYKITIERISKGR